MINIFKSKKTIMQYIEAIEDIKLSDWQKEIILNKDTIQRELIISPRTTGKSYRTIIDAVASCLSNDGYRYLIINPYKNSSNTMIQQTIDLLKNTKLDRYIKINNFSNSITFNNNSTITYFTPSSTGDDLRGHKADTVDMQEYAHYNTETLFNLIRIASYSTLWSNNTRLIISGTRKSVDINYLLLIEQLVLKEKYKLKEIKPKDTYIELTMLEDMENCWGNKETYEAEICNKFNIENYYDLNKTK